MSVIGDVVFLGGRDQPRVRISVPEMQRFAAARGEPLDLEGDEKHLIVVVDPRTGRASFADGAAWIPARGRPREVGGRIGLSHRSIGILEDAASAIYADKMERERFDRGPRIHANPMSVARDPFARGEYRRESAGAGSCSNCGQQRRVLYTYGWESDGGRRGGPAKGKFCGLPCFRAYHDVQSNPRSDEPPPLMVRFTGGRTCAPESKCPYCNGPMGWNRLTTGEQVWACIDPANKSCDHYYARPVSSSGKPYPCETDGCTGRGTVRLEDGSRVCPFHVPRKASRPNPALILVTGNPAPGAVEKAWCKFHQRDVYDGRSESFGIIRGMPPFVFALGRCKSLEIDGAARPFTPQPWLVCSPDDESLWIVTKDVMNLGSGAAGRAIEAITYDPPRESGKTPAYYRHEFDKPLPVLTPVGDPHRCRAVLLDGGAYSVSDWIHE